MGQDPTALFAAYQHSVVTVALGDTSVTVTVGGPIPSELNRPGSVITAVNPGRSAPDAANRQATRALHALLHRRGLWHAKTMSAAVDGTHAEPGFYVPDITMSLAVQIGRAFGQLAIYWLDGHSIRVVACAHPIAYKNPSREPT